MKTETPRTWKQPAIKRTARWEGRIEGEWQIGYEVPYSRQPRMGVVILWRPERAAEYPRVLVSTCAAHGLGHPEDLDRLRVALEMATGEVRAIRVAVDAGLVYDPASVDFSDAPVDAERERMLDLLSAIEGLLSSSVDLPDGADCNVDEVRALLVEHGRLSGEEG